jgi:hypothetical protein
VAILKSVSINPNPVISNTVVNTQSLSNFFQGESIALSKERIRVIGVQPVPSNISEEKLNNINLTPAYFRRKRKERVQREHTEQNDLLLFDRLIQKKSNCNIKSYR